MSPDEERRARACLALFGEWREHFSRVGAAGEVTDQDQDTSNRLLLSAMQEYDRYVRAGRVPPPAPEVY